MTSDGDESVRWRVTGQTLNVTHLTGGRSCGPPSDRARRLPSLRRAEARAWPRGVGRHQNTKLYGGSEAQEQLVPGP